MRITTESMELRILELEDTVKLLAQVAGSLNDMMGTLNEITKVHTKVLGNVLSALGAPDDAKDEDLPPWEAYKG